MGRARDELETSARLSRQPVLTDACRRGDLSQAQAAAVSGAAEADPTAEGRLVAKAGVSTVADLREECARTRAAADPDPEATHRRIRRARSVRRFTGADGAWNLIARGTVDDGARINAALDPLIDKVFRAARNQGRPETHEAYAFDALVALADMARDADDHVRDGSGTSVDPDRRSGRRPAKPNHLALLRLDVEALVRGGVEGDERCEITGVGPIPVGVARRLLGDSVLKLVITKGVDVLNVTHLGRGPTAAQRIALLWASPRCTTEGCHRTRVEIDHRIPWAETHHTRLDQLDPLCRQCHELKTHHGWALVDGTGRRALVPADDPRHPRNHASLNRAGPDPPDQHDLDRPQGDALFSEAG